MTTPAAPPRQQSPPGQQQPGQPPPQPADLADPALALAVALVLVTAVSAAAALAALKARFALPVLAWAALGAVLHLVMRHPPPVTGTIGPASEQVARLNMARRAQYVTAAARRVAGAAREARARGEPVQAAIRHQLACEERYYAQHQRAMWQRAKAAGEVDMAAAQFGNLLGWNAHDDDRVTPECLDADGKNFYATVMPGIGFPGTVHARCRCWPSAPHPGAPLLPSRGARPARAA